MVYSDKIILYTNSVHFLNVVKLLLTNKSENVASDYDCVSKVCNDRQLHSARRQPYLFTILTIDYIFVNSICRDEL